MYISLATIPLAEFHGNFMDGFSVSSETGINLDGEGFHVSPGAALHIKRILTAAEDDGCEMHAMACIAGESSDLYMTVQSREENTAAGFRGFEDEPYLCFVEIPHGKPLHGQVTFHNGREIETYNPFIEARVFSNVHQKPIRFNQICVSTFVEALNGWKPWRDYSQGLTLTIGQQPSIEVFRYPYKD